MTNVARDTSDEAIAAIADPMKRAQALRSIARTNGTLTPTQSEMYREAIAEMRGDDERKQTWIARRLGVSRQAVSALLRRRSASLTTDEVAA